MRVRAAAAAGMIGAVGALLSACARDGTTLRAGDVYVLVGAEGDGDNMAGVGFGGEVSMAGTCLGITLDGTTWTVVWPYGTKVVDRDPLTIDVPGQGRLSVGTALGGGGLQLDVSRLPEGVDRIPAGCPTSFIFSWFPDHS
ncbi:MAG: hypothetical protein U0R80_14945 [Nocardioidaceae bacterium]